MERRGGTWTNEEDAFLMKLVEENGMDWKLISEKMNEKQFNSNGLNRNRKQCRERYVNHLNSKLNHQKWTKTEKQVLIHSIDDIRVNGKISWVKIANQLPGRSLDSIKNQWRCISRQKSKRDYNNDAIDTSLIQGWTSDEDARLRQLCSISPLPSWLWIASHFPKRTDLQCRQHWSQVLMPGLIKGKGTWTPDEDARLRLLVKRHGETWTHISRTLRGRTGKQCRERFRNHVDPALNKGPWTKEEDVILGRGMEEFPCKWTKLREILPGRSENMIKNRWQSILHAQNGAMTEVDKR